MVNSTAGERTVRGKKVPNSHWITRRGKAVHSARQADAAERLKGKRVLIIHQQFAANAVRELLKDAETVTANFFMQIPEFAGPQDVLLAGEDDFTEFTAQEKFDVIIADPAFRRLLPDFRGEFIDFIHFAVSGRLEEDY